MKKETQSKEEKFIELFTDYPVYEVKVMVNYGLCHSVGEYCFTASIVSSKEDNLIDDELNKKAYSKISFKSLDEFVKKTSRFIKGFEFINTSRESGFESDY
jgi:hypothetical protein